MGEEQEQGRRETKGRQQNVAQKEKKEKHAHDTKNTQHDIGCSSTIHGHVSLLNELK